MQRITSIVFLAWWLSAAMATPAFGQGIGGVKPVGVVELRHQLDEAYQARDYQGLLRVATRLHSMRPNNGEYMVQMVLANALLGNRSAAYDMMLQMQRQGLSYDFNSMPDSLKIRDTEAYDHINDMLKLQGEPAGNLTLQSELPGEVRLPTALAWDASRGVLLVGSARDGKVFTVDGEGGVRELLAANGDNGMWGVFGLLVDSARGRLWVASAANRLFKDYNPQDSGHSALFEFDLASLKLLGRYPAPGEDRPHLLGQLAQSASGTLYAVDDVLPVVYSLQPGDDQLKSLVAFRDMVSLRGLAVVPDDSMLYVADYEMGIMAVDLVAHAAAPLRVPDNLNMGGVAGLVYWDGHLVMIQNGNRPERIMRLKLAADGKSVESVAPLAVAQPVFDYPTYGVARGDELWFLASSQWAPGRDTRTPVRIASTSIAKAPELQSPDVEKFMRDHARRLEAEGEAAREAQQKPGGDQR